MNEATRFAAHNRVQRNYYERAFKPRMRPVDSPYLRRQVDALWAFGGLRAGERVLEIGCGMGRYTLPLHDRGLAVEGLDLSPVLLGHLRRFAGARAIPLHEADLVDHAPALAGAFDAVVGFFVLHHLHDLPASFRAVADLLRPGGRAVFIEPNPYNPLYYAQILLSPDMTWEGDRGIVDMRRAKLEKAARGAGLSGAALARFGFFPPRLANLPGAGAVEACVARVPGLNPLLPFQLFRADKAGR